MTIVIEASSTSSENAQRKTFLLSTQELAAANPQIEVVNETVFKSMVSNFFPNRFDPIQIARLRTFEKGELVERWAVVDGHTRLAAIQHLNQQGDQRFDSIRVCDVTDDVLNDPSIVKRKDEHKTTLTVIEYLRAVVEPTKQHAEIAPRRIAAHLINGWKQIVGEELAQEFSAIAALSLLSDPTIPKVPYMLQDSLPSALSGLSVDDPGKGTLGDGVLEMNSILTESGLRPQAVHKEAFMLIASRDPVIGGNQEALLQVYGLLSIPAIAEKLKVAAPNTADQQKLREELTTTALDTMSRLIQHDPHGDTRLVTDVIFDGDLSYKQTIEVLSAGNLEQGYRNAKTTIRADQLTQLYQEQIKGDEQLLALGSDYIHQFATINLPARELRTVAKIIGEAVQTQITVQTALEQLMQNKKQLFASGVKPKTLEEIQEFLKQGLIKAQEAQSHHQLSSAMRTVQNRYEEAQRMIKWEQVAHRVGELVDEHFPPQFFQERFEIDARQMRQSVISYLHSQGDVLFDEQRTAQLVQDVQQLDTDLLKRVFEQQTTLSSAITTQGRRVREQEEKIQRQIKKLDPDLQQGITDQTMTPSQALAQQVIRHGQQQKQTEQPRTEDSSVVYPTGKDVIQPYQQIDQFEEEIGGEKVSTMTSEVAQNQNETLGELFTMLLDELNMMELDPDTVSEENRTLAWQLINTLANMISDKTPRASVQRILEIDYPEALNKIQRLQEDLQRSKDDDIEHPYISRP